MSHRLTMRPFRSVLLALAGALLLLGALNATDARACPPWPPTPPPPAIEQGARGTVTIRTSPASQVSMDGRSLGHTPIQAVYVDPGSHAFRFRASCGETRRTLRVAPGQRVSLALALCPGSTLRR